jgi:hypothetical protein
MSEPAADSPQPEPEKYEWREPRDMNCDVLALVACGVLGDFDGAVTVLASLTDEQTVAVCWAVVCWFAGELGQSFEDPAGEVRRLALVLAHGRGGVA